MGISAAFQAHLESGVTTLARCWRVVRKDGVVFGFTDHDCALAFEGVVFAADSGMTALALEQGTGLGVDNTETLGALSAEAITESDISAGRYDGADVTCWLVNWGDVSQRVVLFAGQIGEITRSGGAFRAEVRGLSEPLNRPVGRVYQKSAPSAGDVDLNDPTLSAVFEVISQRDNRVFELLSESDFEDGWFTSGQVLFESAGLSGVVKADKRLEGRREVELWLPMAVPVSVGEHVRLLAGHDRSFEEHLAKFGNAVDFRGFPDIPGEEWITRVPRSDEVNDGGSLR